MGRGAGRAPFEILGLDLAGSRPHAFTCVSGGSAGGFGLRLVGFSFVWDEFTESERLVTGSSLLAERENLKLRIDLMIQRFLLSCVVNVPEVVWCSL